MKAKKIAILLFSAVIGCTVAKTYSNFQEDEVKVSDIKKERKTNVKRSVKSENVPTVTAEAETKPAQTEAVKPSYGEFTSSQKSGVIGVYGGNSVDNPEDNIFEVVLPSSFSSSDKVVLSYDVEGVAGSTGVALSINDRTAMGGMVAYSSDKRSSVSEEIDAAWLVKGKNRIMFTLPDSANYGYKVSNLKIAITANTAASKIVATASKVDGEVYVRGFVRNSSAKSVNIAGKEYELTQGAFEALISGDDKTVLITCGNESKTLQATTVSGCSASTRLVCANKAEKQTQKEFSLAQKENNKLENEAATLSVDSGVAKQNMKITMTNLRHKDLPALDLGMTNVTDGVDGYRFLPHGAHFEGEGAVVSLKYDRTKIPSGYTENDIRTYYFDLDTKHWVALKRDSIDKENNLIVSHTNHFTDMINGVIQAPESPETQGFTPTMMSDLKLADPTAKIQSIEPPTANNRGSANLSYSFEMPPARNGMQPSLGIQYNSDGGTGLLGEGWDLSVPTISVETRWGVPRYDDNLESETYNMDGSMLVMENGKENYLAHRQNQIGRVKGSAVFHPRKENSFSKIVRLGDKPSEYTWVVTDKSGTKYYYGMKDADGNMKGVLMGKNYLGKDVVAEWKVVRIEEVHGDWIEYEYEDWVTEKPLAQSLRISSVSAGNTGEHAHTTVRLSYSSTVNDVKSNNSISSKMTTSGRYGFLCGQNYLLTKVSVFFGDDKKPLRSYVFDYTKGVFETVLLSSVRHMSGEKEVSKNTFDYHDKLTGNNGFKNTETIDVTKGDKIEVYGPDFLAKITGNLSPLGTTSSLSGSFDVYGGVGFTDGQVTSKSNSAGVTYTFGYSSSKGAISYIDIDGDGLSDMVFKNGSDKKIYYRPCFPYNAGFGSPILIEGISELSESSSISNTVGGKGHVGIGDALVSLGGDYGFSEATTTVYFSDVNGDGLVDLVTDEEVLFNRLVWKEEQKRFVPVFRKGSLGTANPINTSGFTYTIDQDKQDELDKETKENAKQNPMHDVVRVWVAPYDGHVTFAGEVSLVGNNSDGVVLSVQKEGTLISKISITEKNKKHTVSSTEQIQVHKGDRLFFRIQSGDKFDSNGDDDKVVWSPVVSYVEDFGKDVNGLSLSTYDSEKDFLLQMSNYSSLEPLINNNEYNKARFVLDVNKKVDLTDVFSILISIKKKDITSDTGDEVEIESITYDFDEKSGTAQKTIENLFSYMEEGYVYSLSCDLKTKSNIDFGNIEVMPKIEYSNPTMSTPDIKKLVPGYSMYAKNVYYGTSKDIIPVISGFGEANSGWMEGLSVTESTDDTDPLFVWKEEHLTRVDKDNKEEKASVEISVPVSSVMSDLYIVPQFEYSEETENVPVRLVVKKDGKCEYISFGVKNGAYEPVRLQKENSLLSDYLLGNDGETYSGVWLEYYPDTEYGVFEKTVTKSELRVYAKHTTDYTYTVENAEGKETTETKSCTVSLYDSKLENIAFQAAVSDLKYGPMYRNWGQFGYIANEYVYEVDGENEGAKVQKTDVRYENILDLKYLTNDIYSKYQEQFKDLDPENLDENSLPTMDENENAFVTMTADADLNMWVGVPKDINGKSINGVGKSDMWASRSGKQDVVAKDPMSRFAKSLPSENSAVGIDLITKSTSGNSNVGLGGYSLNIGWNGDGNTKTGFVDMNGDSYPDIIENGRIRFTNQRGGFSSTSISSSRLLDGSKSQGLGLGKGQSVNMFPCNSKANEAATINQDQNKQELSSESSCSFGGRIQREYNEHAMVDMNGDGLLDKVNVYDGYLVVSLNTGYGFGTEFVWDKGCIRKSLSFSANGGMNVGFSWSAKSISGGLSTSSASTNTMRDLRDVNGDGLPDLVVSKQVDIPGGFPISLLKKSDKFKDVINDFYGAISEIYINTGSGFEKIGNYGVPLLGSSTSNSGSINGNFTVGFPVWLVKIVASGGGAASGSYSTTDCMLSDYDGDGFPDVLSSGGTPNNMKLGVQLSKIGATNKLKSVTTPFGGTYEMEYTHSTPTQQHPGGKWVMSKLTVKDNIRAEKDCPPVVSEFEYNGGKRDRRERDFYGFAEVKTKMVNAGNVERLIVQNYDTTNYYTSGTSIGSYVCDANHQLFSKDTSEIKMFDVSGQGHLDLATLINESSRIFVAPTKTTSKRFENNVEKGVVANIVENEYGDYGNVEKYTYTDGIAKTGYTTNIKFKPIDKYGVFGLPTDVTVVSDGKTMRHVSAEYDNTGYNPGSMISITQDLGDESATTEFKYDTLGNIVEKIMPQATGDNLMKERMTYTYEYDKKYGMYPIRVTDGFGYRSDMFNYDYRYGIPLSVKDMNGFITEYELDDLGRTTKVIAPNELSAGKDYTVKYEYGVGGNVRMAKTYHYDPQHEDEPMITVNIVDGLGRDLQSRKSAEVRGDNNVMIVSGKTVFDALGREASHFIPTTCSKDKMDSPECDFSDIKTDLTEYDAFDRPVKKTVYDDDNAAYVTEMTYSIENDTLASTVVDPEGMNVATYTDGTEHTIKTIKYHSKDGEAPANTYFSFDGIGQLLTVFDPAGKPTEYIYDMAGRKLSVTYPYSGTTSFTYDNLGNILTKKTGKGDEVSYTYEYNRLINQKYGDKDNWKNNVTYTYGGVDAKHNRVGRIALVEDGSGAQEYFYGKMGEIEKIRRTIIIPDIDVATYTTEWKYDSWNRIQEMVYPDGEKIKYYYNLGGQLKKIMGEKNYICTYVDDIQYDEYEQRSYIKYGNGTETTYKYENVLHRLKNMKVTNNAGTFLHNVYSYDKVNNVLGIKNDAALNVGIGGTMTHTYTYDDWHRLKTANGVFESVDGKKKADYHLVMGHDNLYNITSKKLTMGQTNLQFTGTLSAGHEFNYNYSNDRPMQLASVETKQYNVDGIITDSGKELAKNVRTQNYEFDANGNITSVSVNPLNPEIQESETIEESENKDVLKSFLWDEENRLLAVNNNGSVSCYFYDAAGERTVKLTSESEMVHVNGKKVGGNDAVTKFTAYVSSFFVVSNGGTYTKHIYAGGQRIASKLGNVDEFGADPRRVEQAGGKKYDDNLAGTIKARYDSLGISYSAPKKEDKVEKDSTVDSDEKEVLIFFYHPDHLGSTSYVTDADGNLAQHVEYIPYGEIFVEERNSKFSTNYLFNAKELDNETGLYYYGARYLDPTGAMWLSVDPKWGDLVGMSPYNYCSGNPVKLVDPDGELAWIAVAAIVGGVVNAGLAIYDGKDATEVMAAAASGALAGALCATGAGVIGGAVMGAVGNAVGNVAEQGLNMAFDKMKGKEVREFNGKAVVSAAVTGAATGAAGGVIAKKILNTAKNAYRAAPKQEAARIARATEKTYQTLRKTGGKKYYSQKEINAMNVSARNTTKAIIGTEEEAVKKSLQTTKQFAKAEKVVAETAVDGTQNRCSDSKPAKLVGNQIYKAGTQTYNYIRNVTK